MVMKKNSGKCLDCGANISKSHHNRKRCMPCAKALARRPAGTMTKAQIARAKQMIGKVGRDDIAKKLGVSVPNLKRSMRGVRFWFKNGKWKMRPELTRQIIKYYEKHGMVKTLKRFPQYSVKSVTDRPEYYGIKRTYRQMRWKDSELIEASRMAGLVSHKAQAKYFSRPRAYEGSIKSLWTKNFKLPAGELNGMHWHNARHIVSKDCPKVLTKLICRRNDGAPMGSKDKNIICLWSDMEKHILPGTPDFIKEAVGTLASFQKWLYGTRSVRKKVLELINQRELI
jgi:hypothetical protein